MANFYNMLKALGKFINLTKKWRSSRHSSTEPEQLSETLLSNSTTQLYGDYALNIEPDDPVIHHAGATILMNHESTGAGFGTSGHPMGSGRNKKSKREMYEIQEILYNLALKTGNNIVHRQLQKTCHDLYNYDNPL